MRWRVGGKFGAFRKGMGGWNVAERRKAAGRRLVRRLARRGMLLVRGSRMGAECRKACWGMLLLRGDRVGVTVVSGLGRTWLEIWAGILGRTCQETWAGILGKTCPGTWAGILGRTCQRTWARIPGKTCLEI
ncbi:MAG: hypothetical protein HFH99_00010 [Lachnospiraceae bacterium]|nr:hypothetical protein [Lachnospiraceae bacterium]